MPPIRLGFVRGVAPSKWAERWRRVVRNQALELVPVALDEVESARDRVDVLLERSAPGDLPPGSNADHRTRHALHLYDEAVALVVPAGHDLSDQSSIEVEELELVRLLDHPDHPPAWPAAEAWADPSWMPPDAFATLELVSTGLGGALLPLPLARHLVNKHEHVVIPIAAEAALPGTRIWASWATERDADDVQRLIGVMRGRTARSSR